MSGCLWPGQRNGGRSTAQAFPAVEWQEFRLQGQEWLSERASKKLKNDGLLITSMAGSVLRFEIDQVPLWRGNHASAVKQLVGRFREIPLPSATSEKRPGDSGCDPGWSGIHYLVEGYLRVRRLLRRERGPVPGPGPKPPPDSSALNANSVVVKPEIAAASDSEKDSAPPPTTGTGSGTGAGSAGAGTGTTSSGGYRRIRQERPVRAPASAPPKPKAPVLRRFHGSAKIDATRLSRDVDLIASSVVQHLAGLLDAKVTITVEIEAEIPAGAPDNVVRTVNGELCRTLKFETSGFEES